MRSQPRDKTRDNSKREPPSLGKTSISAGVVMTTCHVTLVLNIFQNVYCE